MSSMKKFFRSLMMFTAVLAAVASCNKKEVDPQVPADGYRYSFSIFNDDTRATLDNEGVVWEATDQVGMFLEGYTGYAKLDVTTTPKSVILYSRQAIPANTYAYAYYPYSTANSAAADKEAAKIVLSKNQEGGVNSAMPMAGIPFLVETEVPLPEDETSTSTNGQIKFLNLGSIIDFKIYSSTYNNETIQYVTFQANDAVLSGDAYLDLTAVDASDESTLELVWMGGENEYDYVKVEQEAPVASAKDDATSIYMVVAPGTYSGTITIGTDVATYTFSYANKVLGRNVIKHYNMNLNNATRSEGVVEVVKTLPYSEEFTSGKGEFSIEGDTGYEWSFSSNYGATVSGYYQADGETEKQNHVANTSLISPWINLSNVADAQITFKHNRNGYLDNSEITLSIQKYGEETWTNLNLTLPDKPSKVTGWSGWKDATVSLSDYVGKKVKVKFNYTSTQSVAGTYEFKQFLVSKVKVAAGIAYAEADQSFTLNLGDDFTAPTLINPNNLTVTYSSNNEDVAAVNATSGVVTLGDEAGTATITATFEENDDYLAGTASYTIKVIDPSVVITKGPEWKYTFSNTDFANAETDYEATYNGLTLTFNSSKAKNQFESSSPSRGVQFGAAIGEFTISISGYTEGIQSIKLVVSSNGTAEANTIEAKVDGVAIGSQVKLDKANNFEIEFASESPLAGGDIVFSLTDTNKSIYVKSIAINSEGGTSADPVKLVMSDITCTNSGENENTLSFSWAAVENATGYQVSEDGGTTYGSTQTSLTYTLTGLSAGTTYSIKVKAIGDGSNYVDSDAKTGTGATKSSQSGDDVYSLYSGNLTEGDYVIVYNNGAMKSSVTSSRLDYSDVTITSNSITGPAEDLVWHIAQSGDNWTIYNAKVAKYAASTKAKNKAQLLESGTDDMSLWTVTVSDGTYDFVNVANEKANVNAHLRRNDTYGFACYASSTGGALILYKKN